MNSETNPFEWDNSIRYNHIERISDKKIFEILEKLMISPLGSDKNEMDKIICSLESAYTNNFRHSYSAINAYLIKKVEGDINKIDQITENLKEIYYSLREIENKKDLSDKIFKLYDHINLEVIQLKFIANTENSIRETSKSIQQAKEEIYNKIEETGKSIQQAKEEIQSELSKHQTNYITILGIFAAIVLSFVGTFTFSTSVLQNIDRTNIFKLTFIILVIGFFIVNILFLLFKFLCKITNTNSDTQNTPYNKTTEWRIFIFSILIFIVIFFILACFKEK